MGWVDGSVFLGRLLLVVCMGVFFGGFLRYLCCECSLFSLIFPLHLQR